MKLPSSAIGRAREQLQRPLLLAHRGAHDGANPENSLAALRLGAAQCDGVEFDVRFSSDGVAVVVHDESLDRLFQIPQRVSEMSGFELASVGVPTLAEVLAAMPTTTLIDLELKEEPTEGLFTTVIAARGREARGVVFSSFSPGVLHALEASSPDWPRWLNAETAAEADRASGLGCTGLSVAIEHLTDANIRGWCDAGLEVATWTLRDVQGAGWAREPRLVAICVEGAGATAARAAMR